MAVIETWFNQDLQKPVKVQYIDGSLFSNNGNGNRIGVNVYDNGEAVTLTGSVSGYAVLSDGTTVPCTGARSGNKASILVPPAAYVPGALFLSVFLTDGETVTTLAAVSTSVLLARTDSQVDPGTVVADWTQTINGAMQDVQTAAENLGQIVATPYPSLTYPVPLGKYTYFNGNLYRCVSPIAASENFTPAHWSAEINLGDEVSALKSAFDNSKAGEIETSGYASYQIAGTISPQGQYSINSGGKHCRVPVFPGDTVKIIANANFQTIYAVLRSFDKPVQNAVPDFSTATGFTGRLTLTKGTDITFTVPSDGAYLYFTTIATNDYTPMSVSVNGAEMFYGLRNRAFMACNDVVGSLNDLKSTGLYGMPSTGDYDAPATNTKRFVIASALNTSYVRQIFFDVGRGAIYLRAFANGAWDNWTVIDGVKINYVYKHFGRIKPDIVLTGKNQYATYNETTGVVTMPEFAVVYTDKEGTDTEYTISGLTATVPASHISRLILCYDVTNQALVFEKSSVYMARTVFTPVVAVFQFTGAHQNTVNEIVSWLKFDYTETRPWRDEIIGAINDASYNNIQFMSAFAVRKPRFIFSKGKMWVKPWNSAEAYTAAGKDDRCFAINGDVQKTSDGYYVMYHDLTIDDKTTGSGTVNNMTLAQLEAVDIDKGVWNGTEFISGGETAKIPQYYQYLDICRKYGKMAFIETKGTFDTASVDEIIQMVKDRGMENCVAFLVPKTIGDYIRSTYPQIAQFWILDESFNDTQITNILKVKNQHPAAWVANMTDESLRNKVRKNGRLLMGYSVRAQTDADITNAIAYGCDLIGVDREIPSY